MTTISHIRGMLLEEVLLYYLQMSGYKAVDPRSSDPAMRDSPTGLEVVGRGETHPIAAVADFVITPPFTRPQRLLIEAKSYADAAPVGMGVIRQAVGILRDVDENWLTVHQPAPPVRSYRYQYALFSSSTFSPEAQAYAFAQNIRLIPLGGMPQLRPLIRTIHNINHNHFKANNWNAITTPLAELRLIIRKLLQGRQDERLLRVLGPALAVKPLMRVVRAGLTGPNIILGTLAQHLTVPLILAADLSFDGLDSFEWHVRGQKNHWTLQPRDRESPLIAFDFPAHLFQLYARQGVFSGNSEIQAIVIQNEAPHILRLPLSPNWLNQIEKK